MITLTMIAIIGFHCIFHLILNFRFGNIMVLERIDAIVKFLSLYNLNFLTIIIF